MLTENPLPYLTGLTRGMRYSTAGVGDLEALLFPRLAKQARDGLAMLRRLEACAAAWRDRLTGLITRSRAGAAAGVFLVWPACKRPQLAATLGTSPAGSGTVLAVFIERGVVQRQTRDGVAFYIAPESLGAFKLVSRQRRHAAVAGMSAVAEFDAASATSDLLGIVLDEIAGSHANGEAYQHQP